MVRRLCGTAEEGRFELRLAEVRLPPITGRERGGCATPVSAGQLKQVSLRKLKFWLRPHSCPRKCCRSFLQDAQQAITGAY